jgi:hypoxanthine phosphoribosyltransferase
MSELIPVFDKNAIAHKIAAVAKHISADYQDADLVLVGVLKGAFIFMADLIRQLELKKVAVDFVQLASYGSDTQSSGTISILKDLSSDIRNKDVLVVEDILDTGCTLAFLIDHLRGREPRSIKTCALIDKQERRQEDIKADYVCHQVEAGFLVGYGLDFAEEYRNLPEIYHLKR